jgi:hypothetical protein
MTITSKFRDFFVKTSLKSKLSLLVLLLSGLLTACGTMQVDISHKMVLPAYTRLAVGPLANHSDTPLANRQVESMLVSLLHAKGFKNIVHYQRPKACAKLLYCPDETLSRAQILQWARMNNIAFVLTGAANEWRYKVGLDGEPVAGVSLVLIHVNSGRTVWTSVGSAIGGSRSGLDVIGQSLLVCLLKGLNASFTNAVVYK